MVTSWEVAGFSLEVGIFAVEVAVASPEASVTFPKVAVDILKVSVVLLGVNVATLEVNVATLEVNASIPEGSVTLVEVGGTLLEVGVTSGEAMGMPGGKGSCSALLADGGDVGANQAVRDHSIGTGCYQSGAALAFSTSFGRAGGSPNEPTPAAHGPIARAESWGATCLRVISRGAKG